MCYTGGAAGAMIDGLRLFFVPGETMADEISSDIGDDADTVASGKGINQNKNDAHSNPRQSTRQQANPQQTTYVNQPESSQWVVAQILDHASQIRELAYRLDDLPAKFTELKEQVRKLADVEITVSPSAVVIKPVAPPDTITLSSRMLLRILIVSVVVIVGLVAYLIYSGARMADWAIIYAAVLFGLVLLITICKGLIVWQMDRSPLSICSFAVFAALQFLYLVTAAHWPLWWRDVARIVFLLALVGGQRFLLACADRLPGQQER